MLKKFAAKQSCRKSSSHDFKGEVISHIIADDNESSRFLLLYRRIFNSNGKNNLTIYTTVHLKYQYNHGFITYSLLLTPWWWKYINISHHRSENGCAAMFWSTVYSERPIFQCRHIVISVAVPWRDFWHAISWWIMVLVGRMFGPVLRWAWPRGHFRLKEQYFTRLLTGCLRATLYVSMTPTGWKIKNGVPIIWAMNSLIFPCSISVSFPLPSRPWQFNKSYRKWRRYIRVGSVGSMKHPGQ